MIFKNSTRKGFTLIELLVVVAIISLLSSVVFASLNSARVKARDAKRLESLHEIRTALELYYNTNNAYPVIGRWAMSEATPSYDTSGAGWAALQTYLSPYIASLPNDPKATGTSGPWYTGNYHYAYSSDGQTYDLVGQLEDTNNKNICTYKQWRYHQGEGSSYPPESVWCNVGLSPYLFEDH